MASIFKAHPVELGLAIRDPIKGDISFGPNSFKTYVSPKVRDLAESRTGVRSRCCSAARQIRPGSRWVALISAHFHFNSWMVTVCLDFWQMVFESSRQWCTFRQWNNVVRGQQRILHQGHAAACPPPSASTADALPFFLIDANMHKQILKRFRHNGHLQ